MHRAFRFGMDKLDAVNYPNFLSEEIDLLLNQAQERFVKQRYGITNIKRTSFEETEKRTEDLKEVIRQSVITPIPNSGIVNLGTNITTNSVFCTLPTDHWFTIWERAIIVSDRCNLEDIVVRVGDLNTEVTGKYVEVRPVQHLEIDKILNDPFKAPDYDKVLRIMYENKAEIIPAPYSTVAYYLLRYVKKPQTVSITTPTNCELSEHTHQEIVDMAIQIALEGIEAKRNNTFTPIINNTNE